MGFQETVPQVQSQDRVCPVLRGQLGFWRFGCRWQPDNRVPIGLLAYAPRLRCRLGQEDFQRPLRLHAKNCCWPWRFFSALYGFRRLRGRHCRLPRHPVGYLRHGAPALADAVEKPVEEHIYKGTGHCFKTIAAEEGLAKGLYKGFVANIVRSVGGALVLVLYDRAKIYLEL